MKPTEEQIQAFKFLVDPHRFDNTEHFRNVDDPNGGWEEKSFPARLSRSFRQRMMAYEPAYQHFKKVFPKTSLNADSPEQWQAFADCDSFLKDNKSFQNVEIPENGRLLLLKEQNDYEWWKNAHEYVEGKVIGFLDPQIDVFGVQLPTLNPHGFLINLEGKKWAKDFLVNSPEPLWKDFYESFKNNPETILETASDTRFPLEHTNRLYLRYMVDKLKSDPGINEKDRAKMIEDIEKILKNVFKEGVNEFSQSVGNVLSSQKFSDFIGERLRKAFEESGILAHLSSLDDLISGVKSRVDFIEKGTKRALEILEKFESERKKENEETEIDKIEAFVKGFHFLGQVGQLIGSPVIGKVAIFGEHAGRMVQAMIELRKLSLVKTGIFKIVSGWFTVGSTFLSLILSFLGGGPDPLLLEILSRLKEIDKKLTKLLHDVDFIDYKMDVYHIEVLRNFVSTFGHLRMIRYMAAQLSNDIENFRQEVIDIAVGQHKLKYEELASRVSNHKYFNVSADLFQQTFEGLSLLAISVPRLPLYTSSNTAVLSNGELNYREMKTRLNRGFQHCLGLLLELSEVAHGYSKHPVEYEMDGNNALSINIPAYFSGVSLFIKYLISVDNTTVINAYKKNVQPLEHMKKEVDTITTLGAKVNGNLLKMGQSCVFLDFLFEEYRRAYDLVKQKLPEDFDKYRTKKFPLNISNRVKEIQIYSENIDKVVKPPKIWVFMHKSGALGYSFFVPSYGDTTQYSYASAYSASIQSIQKATQKDGSTYFYECPTFFGVPVSMGVFGPSCALVQYTVRQKDDRLEELFEKKKEEIKKKFDEHVMTYKKMQGTSVYNKVKDDFSLDDLTERLVPLSLVLYPDEKNHPLHQFSLPLTHDFQAMASGARWDLFGYFVMAEYLNLGVIRFEYSTNETLSVKIYFTIDKEPYVESYFSEDMCSKHNLTWPCASNNKTLVSHIKINALTEISDGKKHFLGESILDKNLQKSWPNHPRLIAEDYPSVLSVWPISGNVDEVAPTETIKKFAQLIEDVVKKVEASTFQSYYRDVFVDVNADHDKRLLDAVEQMDVCAQLIRAHTSLVLAQNPTAQFFLDQEKYLWDKADLYEMAATKGFYPSKIASEMDANAKELENHRKCFAEVACGNATEEKCSSGVEKPAIGNPLLNVTLLVLRNFRTILENSTITVGKPDESKADKTKTGEAKTDKPKAGEAKTESDKYTQEPTYNCGDDGICIREEVEDEFGDEQALRQSKKMSGQESQEDSQQEPIYSKPASSSAIRNAPFFYLSIIWLRALHESTISYLSQPSNLISPEIDQVESIDENVESMSTALAIPAMQIPTTEHHEFVMDMMSNEGKLLYNGGSCAFTPEFNQFAGGYIFTCVAYLDKRPVGYVKLFNEPQLCFSTDKTRNNIMEVGGIFRHASLNSDAAAACSALPLTFYDRSCSAMKLGALQGSMRGVSDVVENSLVHVGHSAQKAWLISNGIYYGATFTVNFVSYQTHQDYVTASTMALKDVAILATTSLATSTASRGLYWAASTLAEKGWKVGSTVVSFAAKTVSYLPFAYQTYQDPTIAPISIVTGVVSQKATVKSASVLGKVFGFFRGAESATLVSSGVAPGVTMSQTK
ncbi:MAG: hypothetical protein SFW07_03510 [Gammaproteobacteria bacterium]|nr:hypothetical protein [Gammaproteobacteria bacterium]